MNKEQRREEIARMSKTILSYCMARTDNRQDAEDMAQDILYECCKSAENLRDEKAFYGFVWRIADNVCKTWYRKKAKLRECEIKDGIPAESVDLDELFRENEQLGLVRRELALLNSNYRRAMIEYYIDGRSCKEVAHSLSISESMVKYLLFQSRKRIKEGVNMERIYGEQSYNPVKLGLRFWGDKNIYWSLLENKIPQNIIMACYYEKLTEEQLSIQLGVPTAYLEDDINKLLEYGLLKRTGVALSSDIVIVTKQAADEISTENARSVNETAEYFKTFIDGIEKQVREIGFYGYDMPLNALRWQLASKLLRMAYINMALDNCKLEYPNDIFGNKCFRWCVEETCENLYGLGLATPENEQGSIECFDIRINGEFVHLTMCNNINRNLMISLTSSQPVSYNDKAICSELISRGFAVKTGNGIKPNCPYFTKEQSARLNTLLEEPAKEICRQAMSRLDVVTLKMREHAPKRLQDYAEKMAVLQQFGEAEEIIRLLCEDGYLLPYKGGILPTTAICLR